MSAPSEVLTKAPYDTATPERVVMKKRGDQVLHVLGVVGAVLSLTALCRASRCTASSGLVLRQSSTSGCRAMR